MRTWRKWSAGLAAAALLSVGATASRAGAAASSALAPQALGQLPLPGLPSTSQPPVFERVATIQTTRDLDGESLGQTAGQALATSPRRQPGEPSLTIIGEPTATAQGPEFIITPPDGSTPTYDPASEPLMVSNADVGAAFYSRDAQRRGGFRFSSSDGTAANEPTPHAIPFQTSAQLFPVGAVLAAYAIYRIRRKRSRTVPVRH